MDKKTKSICNSIVENYKEIRDKFRYDGDYINHFSSILYGKENKKIEYNKVKEIRSLIKGKTSRISSFRGDILYVLSFLIAKNNFKENDIDTILDLYSYLLESGFKDSQYLVLTAYVLYKHSNKKNIEANIKNTKEIYMEMKFKYKNVTNEDDYLECALLSIKGKNKGVIDKYMDDIFMEISKLNMFSANSIQGLATTLLLNGENDVTQIKNILMEFKNENIKIAHQFLPLIGYMSRNGNVNKYMLKIKEIMEYLCELEYEYEYYMDSSFRVIIGIAIIEFSENNEKKPFLEELFSVGIYEFIHSKNQGLLEEVMA